MSHDQTFKNLILDYPREALAFFAAPEGEAIPPDARIIPVRQEQLQERLGERFRELDTPLLVEWPDGRREAILFVVEEETQPRRFSIHRLIHYCVDLAELFNTDRVVPVVIFLHRGDFPTALRLGGDRGVYLDFRFLYSVLAELPAVRYQTSDNIVARLNLLNMSYPRERKVALYAAAQEGLASLEPDPEKRLKYGDFIELYGALTDDDIVVYERDYLPQSPHREVIMGYAQYLREQGIDQGIHMGLQRVVRRLLIERFGPLPESIETRLTNASAEQLDAWSFNLLKARTLDEVFAE